MIKWKSPEVKQEIRFQSKDPEFRSRYLTLQTRREVWARDGGKCIACGSKLDLEFDHIIPFSKGGSNETPNIQILCRRCNSKKKNKIDA